MFHILQQIEEIKSEKKKAIEEQRRLRMEEAKARSDPLDRSRPGSTASQWESSILGGTGSEWDGPNSSGGGGRSSGAGGAQENSRRSSLRSTIHTELEGMFTLVLIHEADPQTRPVVITIFARGVYPSVRPSQIFKSCKTKFK